MNEMVSGVARHPQLVAAMPGGLPPYARSAAAASRERCAYVAAVMTLLGGDTTPKIYGMTEETGLKLAVEHAAYVCGESRRARPNHCQGHLCTAPAKYGKCG